MIKKIVTGLVAFLLAAVAFATEVNTASQAELDAVKGIGPALSARIVDARKTGPFKDWGDLVSRVKGVGEKNSAEFSAGGLTVNGSAKSGAPAQAAAPRKTSKTATAAMPAPATTATATAATAATAATTATATAPAPGAASAPMTAADKKAARKAAKEEKARQKAANSAAGAASAASTPARK